MKTTDAESNAESGIVADRKAASLVNKGREVKISDLGIKGASDTDTVRIIEGENETDSMKEARRLAEERGLKVTFFVGGNLIITEKGKTISARGYISPESKQVFVRADHALYTAEQLMKHEIGHDMIDNGEISIEDVRERLKKIVSAKNVDALAAIYAASYEGSGLEYDDIWEELICDSVADMNVFAGSVIGALGDIVTPQIKEKALSSAKAPTQTRGSPDGKASWELGLSNSQLIEVHLSNKTVELTDPQNITSDKVLNYMQMARNRKLIDETYFPIRSHIQESLLDILRNNGIDIENKPLLMQAKKARQSQIEAPPVKKNKIQMRYHALSKEEMLEAIENIGNPTDIVLETNRTARLESGKIVYLPDSYAIFVTLSNGKQCVVVLQFDSIIDIDAFGKNYVKNNQHTTVTIFEPDIQRSGMPFNYLDYLLESDNNFELKVDKKTKGSNPKATIGGNPAAASGREPSNTSIPQNSDLSIASSKKVSDGKTSRELDTDTLNEIVGKNARTAIENVYSYDAITEKDDLNVVTFSGKIPMTVDGGKFDNKEIVNIGRKNARNQKNKNNTETSTYVYVKDIGVDVLLGSKGLKHGLERNDEATAMAVMHAGDILANSIVINEMDASLERGTEMSYILLTACEFNGDDYVVRSVVSKEDNSVSGFDLYKLGAVKGKKIDNPNSALKRGAAVTGQNPLISSGYRTISISNFLENVKSIPLINEVFSRDVAQKLGVTRSKGTLTPSLRYSRELDFVDFVNKNSDGVETVTNRTLLANALESATINDVERQNLKKYKDNIALIEAEEAKLNAFMFLQPFYIEFHRFHALFLLKSKLFT